MWLTSDGDHRVTVLRNGFEQTILFGRFSYLARDWVTVAVLSSVRELSWFVDLSELTEYPDVPDSP